MDDTNYLADLGLFDVNERLNPLGGLMDFFHKKGLEQCWFHIEGHAFWRLSLSGSPYTGSCDCQSAPFGDPAEDTRA
jgi:hypothetical protein